MGPVRLPLSPAATLAVDGPDGCGRERQDDGRDAAECFCGSLRRTGARNAAHGKIASLVSPRISMSGFGTERPPAGPHSAPRARGDNLHDASSSPSSPCLPRSSTSTSRAWTYRRDYKVRRGGMPMFWLR